MRFTTASDASAQSGVKALVYAEAGMGKTVLSATLPTPVLISAESGLLCLRKPNLERLFGANNPSITYNMPVIEINTITDLRQAYDWCVGSAEAKSFLSIGLDSISEIAETVLATAKKGVKDPRQAYGELIDQMEDIVRKFRDLPGKNVYFSAKMEPMKDETTGLIKYGPSLPGNKLGPKLPYFFDECFRLGVNKTQTGEAYRFLQTQPDLQFTAKDRSGALDPIEIPHLSQIFAKIMQA